LKGHTDSISSLAFSPKYPIIATGSPDKTAILFNIDYNNKNTFGSILKILSGHSSSVNSITFSCNGDYLATGSWDGQIIIHNSNPTNEEFGIIKTRVRRPTGSIYNIIYSPSGKELAVGGFDGETSIYGVNPLNEKVYRKQIIRLSGHKKWIYSISFSPDGLRIVTGGFDNFAIIHSLSSNENKDKIFLKEPKGVIYVVLYSLSGNFIACGSEDKCVYLYNGIDKKDILGLLLTKISNHKSIVRSICFSLDESIIITGGEDKLLITNKLKFANSVYKGISITTYKEFKQNGFVNSLKISNNGEILAVGLSDYTSILYC